MTTTLSGCFLWLPKVEVGRAKAEVGRTKAEEEGREG